MTRQRTRRWTTVIAIALFAFTPATPSFAAKPSCDRTLLPSEIMSVGTSCRLAAGTVVSVAKDLDVAVPEPGLVASVEVLRAHHSTAPSMATVYRAADDQLALQIDEEPVLGPAATAAALNRILTRHPEATGATGTEAPTLAAVPPWCGSTYMYSLHAGVWRNGVYPWLYNSRTQPNTGALSAIQFGFKFITDDTSDCGSAQSIAAADYRGPSTRYTWGTRDFGNVIGWAGFDQHVLAHFWSWTDPSGYKVEGDVAFNNRRTNWFTGLSGTVPSNRTDLISVATHEAGHIFGLNHANWDTQVMWASLGQGVNKRVKRSGDLTGIAVKYCGAHCT
jgi:hypothetical protein